MQSRGWTLPPVELPDDARTEVKKAFREANRCATAQLSIAPNRHETDLDGALITSLGSFSQRQFPSGVVVTIEAIFVGGGGRAGPEPGDIALVVQFLRGGAPMQAKLGLIQSKRLYPQRVPLQGTLISAAQYHFTDQSRYNQLVVADQQYVRIEQDESTRKVPVFYLLYNSWQIPWTVQVPLIGASPPRGRVGVGCRVIPSAALRGALSHLSAGSTPSYAEIARNLPLGFQRRDTVAGWRLEDFVLEVMDCRQGAIGGQAAAELIETFRSRDRAHSSAIIISVDGSPDATRIT